MSIVFISVICPGAQTLGAYSIVGRIYDGLVGLCFSVSGVGTMFLLMISRKLFPLITTLTIFFPGQVREYNYDDAQVGYVEPVVSNIPFFSMCMPLYGVSRGFFFRVMWIMLHLDGLKDIHQFNSQIRAGA